VRKRDRDVGQGGREGVRKNGEGEGAWKEDWSESGKDHHVDGWPPGIVLAFLTGAPNDLVRPCCTVPLVAYYFAVFPVLLCCVGLKIG
jgi:hypothetical protein